jgi:molybdopterin-biosynthesis enzyme MoeA-like protein
VGALAARVTRRTANAIGTNPELCCHAAKPVISIMPGVPEIVRRFVRKAIGPDRNRSGRADALYPASRRNLVAGFPLTISLAAWFESLARPDAWSMGFVTE